jgi:Family of unknown function (DUF5681)
MVLWIGAGRRTTHVAAKTAGKQRGKPFEPGRSGNPKGRPEGSRHATTLAVEKLLEGEAEEIGRKAVELAKSGDTVALRLCLEPIAPIRKGRAILLSLPSMSTPADVTTALSAIVTQMAEGEITPEEAAIAASVIGQSGKLSKPKSSTGA